MEAVVFIGIPGCGKTTFYRERFFDTHIRISLDMLKTRNRERLLLAACLAAQQPFVIDNTNVLASERAAYIEPAKAAGFRVTGCYFSVPLGDAIRRNKKREGKKAIPVAGIAAKFKRLQAPQWQEGFDALFSVSLDEASGFAVTSLEPARLAES